ncbi:hypothetical protein [Streptomyces sp. S186]|uniref:hypothetical protein n=1 Tax=Streptomyces sp. S186 TaxID=3434395 RepID=UPI003F6642D5
MTKPRLGPTNIGQAAHDTPLPDVAPRSCRWNWSRTMLWIPEFVAALVSGRRVGVIRALPQQT